MPTLRKKSEDRRREIADVTLRIISERGVAGLTAAAIARRLQVTDAALFHHFPTMDAIVVAAIDRVEELLFGEPPPTARDAIERLGAFFAQRAATMRRNPGALRLVLSDVLPQIAPPSAVAKVDALRRSSVGFIRACVRAAQRQGTLAGRLRVTEATVLVLGALMALTQAHDLLGVEGSFDTLAADVWRRLESVLRGRPARRRRPKAQEGVP